MQTINEINFIYCDEETRSQQDSWHNVLGYTNFRVLLHNSVVVVWLGFFFWEGWGEGAKGRMFGSSGVLSGCGFKTMFFFLNFL